MDKQPEYKNVKARISESMLLHIRLHESEGMPNQGVVLRGGEPKISGSRTGTKDTSDCVRTLKVAVYTYL